MEKRLFIKNMVCDRCIKVLDLELNEAGINLKSIELGAIVYEEQNTKDMEVITTILKANGLEQIRLKEDLINEEVKHILLESLNDLPIKKEVTISKKLSESLGLDYSKISKTFSYKLGVTIERYLIRLKIEKVKELIQTRDLNFTEISHEVGYSSVGSLSAVFKRETGMSLTTYKSLNKNFRKSLDKIE